MGLFGKILGIGLVAVGIGALIFQPQLAPLFAGALGASAGAGLAITQLLSAAALTLGQRALISAPKFKSGIQTGATVSGEDQPESTIVGRYATAGAQTYPTMSFDKDRFLVQRIELSDIPGCQLLRVSVDGEWITLDGNNADIWGAQATGKYADRVWVKYFDGTQTADSQLMADKFGADPNYPYDAAMVGAGRCYAVVIAKFDNKLFPSQPVYRFELEGIPLYDPRFDTSVGGSGTQRWATPSTWAQTRNPMVTIYNIMRGITLPDGSVWGGKAAASDLPLADWFAAMNDCDEQVQIGGGVGNRYQCGFEIKFDQQPSDVVEELLKSCSGVMSDVGGVWYPRAGSPDLPVFTITDGIMLGFEEVGHTPHAGLEKTANALTVSYPDPTQNYEPREVTPLTNAAWEAEDGQRLTRQVSLSAVPFPGRAQIIANELHSDERRQSRHVLSLPRTLFAARPMQVLDFTSIEFGHIGKDFEIASVTRDLATLNVQMLVREVNPADFTPPTIVDTALASPVNVGPDDLVVTGFDVTATTVPDAAGINRRPAVQIVWTDPPSDVIGADFQVRINGTLVVDQHSTNDVSSMIKIIVLDVSGQTYNVRMKYATNDRPTTWTSWVNVIIPDLRLSELDVNATIQQKLDLAVTAASAASAADIKAQGVRDDHDGLVLGFVGTLDSAFSDVDADITIAKQLALAVEGVPANAELPAEGWTDLSWAASANLIKPAVSAAQFLNGGYEFPDTLNRSFGQAAGVPYEHGHFYEVTFVFTVITGPVQVRFILTRQTGTDMVTPSVSTGVFNHQTTEGEITKRVQFALAPDAAATGADATVSLATFTDAIDRIYPHIRQNPVSISPTAGRIRVRRMIVRDVTQEVSARAFTQSWAYSVSEADGAIAASGSALKAQIEDPAGTSVGATLNQESITRASQDNALAADITSLTATVSGNSGDITNILGLTVGGTEAFGVLMTQLAVDAGGTSATITQQGSAIATLDGNASAAQVFRAKAGTAGAELELVAWDNAGGGASSVARISADDIILDGTVSTKKLIVSDGSGNLWVNGNFAFGDTRGWMIPPAGVSIVERNPASGANVIKTAPFRYFARFDPDTGGGDINWGVSDRVPVIEGETYAIKALLAGGGVGIAPNMDVIMSVADQDGNFIGGSFGSFTPTLTSWNPFEKTFTIPTGGVSAELRLRRRAGAGKTAFIGDIQLIRKVSGATLLTPNSVTANEAFFTSLASLNLTAGNVDIDNLSVNTIKIADSSVTIMRAAAGDDFATITFTPAATGVVIIFGQVLVPVVDANDDVARIEIVRGGVIVDQARGEFLRTSTIVRSFATTQGVSETFTIQGRSMPNSNNVVGDFANIVILERFK